MAMQITVESSPEVYFLSSLLLLSVQGCAEDPPGQRGGLAQIHNPLQALAARRKGYECYIKTSTDM